MCQIIVCLLLNLGEGVVFDFSDLRKKVKMPKRFSTLHMKMLYFDWIISVYYFEQFMHNPVNGCLTIPSDGNNAS